MVIDLGAVKVATLGYLRSKLATKSDGDVIEVMRGGLPFERTCFIRARGLDMDVTALT